MNAWLKANVLVLLMGLQILVGAVFWVSSLDATANSANAALVTINARMDRVFVALDDIRGQLPVLSVEVQQLQAEMADAKGASGSLEARLRLMENNLAAVHSEATDPRRQH